MAQQHTTPERSLAAAYAHQERAVGVGQESRLKKDPCYQLYEESLKCGCLPVEWVAIMPVGAGKAGRL